MISKYFNDLRTQGYFSNFIDARVVNYGSMFFLSLLHKFFLNSDLKKIIMSFP